jgi:hypothetical protein
VDHPHVVLQVRCCDHAAKHAGQGLECAAAHGALAQLRAPAAAAAGGGVGGAGCAARGLLLLLRLLLGLRLLLRLLLLGLRLGLRLLCWLRLLLLLRGGCRAAAELLLEAADQEPAVAARLRSTKQRVSSGAASGWLHPAPGRHDVMRRRR